MLHFQESSFKGCIIIICKPVECLVDRDHAEEKLYFIGNCVMLQIPVSEKYFIAINLSLWINTYFSMSRTEDILNTCRTFVRSIGKVYLEEIKRDGDEKTLR